MADTRHFYNEKEDELIRKFYNEPDGKQYLIELLGVSEKSLTIRASKIHASKERIRWNGKETNMVRKEYHKSFGADLIKDKIGRTKKAVRRKADKLGATRKNWTKEAEELVREYYGQPNGMQILRELFPEKTKSAIIGKAHRLGLTGK